MRYEKPWLSYDEQADLLIGERGLVADRNELMARLREVGYYRLSGYWYVFEGEGTGRFRQGTTLGDVWGLYTFDRQFRLVVLDAIERIEVYFRARLAHLLAGDGGAFGYMDKAGLPRLADEEYDAFVFRCREALGRSREPFAIHFKERYGDCHELPPYWILVNLMDFGMMLRLFKGAPTDIRSQLSSELDVASRVLNSWLVALNTTRNICAHHGRLWNRGIGTRPIIPAASKNPEWHVPFRVRSDNMCGILTLLSFLLERVAPGTAWRRRLFDLLSTRSQEELNRMGFIEGWEECPIWKPWVEDAAVGR